MTPQYIRWAILPLLLVAFGLNWVKMRMSCEQYCLTITIKCNLLVCSMNALQLSRFVDILIIMQDLKSASLKTETFCQQSSDKNVTARRI